MECKTLKDLRYKTGNSKVLDINSIELKQEAIKWIKKLDFCCNADGFTAEEEIQKWIKHFFNIKDTDLSERREVKE